LSFLDTTYSSESLSPQFGLGIIFDWFNADIRSNDALLKVAILIRLFNDF
jgi:hypothetical protein